MFALLLGWHALKLSVHLGCNEITRGYLPDMWHMLGTIVIQEMKAEFSLISLTCLCGEGSMKLPHTLVKQSRYIFLFLILNEA